MKTPTPKINNILYTCAYLSKGYNILCKILLVTTMPPMQKNMIRAHTSMTIQIINKKIVKMPYEQKEHSLPKRTIDILLSINKKNQVAAQTPILNLHLYYNLKRNKKG